MINLQKVLVLMGIHNLTSVFFRIINLISEHSGLNVVFFFFFFLLDLITFLKAKCPEKKSGIMNIQHEIIWDNVFVLSLHEHMLHFSSFVLIHENSTIPQTGKSGLTF